MVRKPGDRRNRIAVHHIPAAANRLLFAVDDLSYCVICVVDACPIFCARAEGEPAVATVIAATMTTAFTTLFETLPVVATSWQRLVVVPRRLLLLALSSSSWAAVGPHRRAGPSTPTRW